MRRSLAMSWSVARRFDRRRFSLNFGREDPGAVNCCILPYRQGVAGLPTGMPELLSHVASGVSAKSRGFSLEEPRGSRPGSGSLGDRGAFRQ